MDVFHALFVFENVDIGNLSEIRVLFGSVQLYL